MSMTTSFRERLAFDEHRGEWRDGAARYVIIRHDSLMGLFRRLPPAARQAALAAFADSVAKHGSNSVETYRATAVQADALLDVIARTARELGWGRWNFARAENALHLEVANSPFAAGYGPAPQPVCAGIGGMLHPVAAVIFGGPAMVDEISCAAVADEFCCFVARPMHPGATTGKTGHDAP